MPRRRRLYWFPTAKSQRLFEDTFILAQYIVSVYVLGLLITFLLPSWKEATEATEFFIFIGLIVVQAVLYFRDLVRGDKLHVFAAA